MKVVGEEGTSTEDYILYMKAEFLDSVYLQQNAFDPVDAAVSADRQRHVFGVMFDILTAKFDIKSKDEVRGFFNNLRQKFLDYNGSEWNSDEFKSLENEIRGMIEEKSVGIEHSAQHLLEETNA
jgi:V/A-type H+-transporting ATPase subunit A